MPGHLSRHPLRFTAVPVPASVPAYFRQAQGICYLISFSLDLWKSHRSIWSWLVSRPWTVLACYALATFSVEHTCVPHWRQPGNCQYVSVAYSDNNTDRQHSWNVNDIFRSHGWKLSIKFRYFPSLQTEIKCYNSLLSVHENLLVSFSFRPQKT